MYFFFNMFYIQTCFALGATVIGELEGSLIGVHASNSGIVTQNFTFDACINMMLLDAILYAVLAWYLDQVLPTEFGTQRPVYFLFTRDYWCGPIVSDLLPSGGASSPFSIDNHELTKALLVANEQEGGLGESKEGESNDKFEAVSDFLTRQLADGRAVSIRGLRKVYKTTAEDKVAVKSLDLDMFEGQITVLLGHK
jgi:ATP-binding cassette subfamily A (ABC1) protein 3